MMFICSQIPHRLRNNSIFQQPAYIYKADVFFNFISITCCKLLHCHFFTFLFYCFKIEKYTRFLHVKSNCFGDIFAIVYGLSWQTLPPANYSTVDDNIFIWIKIKLILDIINMNSYYVTPQINLREYNNYELEGLRYISKKI